jgi:hypothetical protein
VTYGTACMAASAGVSVARAGTCETEPGGACGSRGAAVCDPAQYCQFPAGADCGRADAPGVCTDTPQACDLAYVPVCGCDGMTYGNACAAAMAGVSLEAQGE